MTGSTGIWAWMSFKTSGVAVAVNAPQAASGKTSAILQSIESLAGSHVPIGKCSAPVGDCPDIPVFLAGKKRMSNPPGAMYRNWV